MAKSKKNNIEKIVGKFVGQTFTQWKKEFYQFGMIKPVKVYRCKTKGYADLNSILDRKFNEIRVSFYWEDIPLGNVKRKDPDAITKDDLRKSIDELDYNIGNSTNVYGNLIASVGKEEVSYSISKYDSVAKEMKDAISEGVKERKKICSIPY